MTEWLITQIRFFKKSKTSSSRSVRRLLNEEVTLTKLARMVREKSLTYCNSKRDSKGQIPNTQHLQQENQSP